MFKRIFPPAGKQVTIYFEGIPITVDEGTTVAAAVLLAPSGDYPQFNRLSAKKHEKRGAYCNMGICFECMMEINGKPNQQSCIVIVQEDMCVKRQLGSPDFGLKPEPAPQD